MTNKPLFLQYNWNSANNNVLDAWMEALKDCEKNHMSSFGSKKKWGVFQLAEWGAERRWNNFYVREDLVLKERRKFQLWSESVVHFKAMKLREIAQTPILVSKTSSSTVKVLYIDGGEPISLVLAQNLEKVIFSHLMEPTRWEWNGTHNFCMLQYLVPLRYLIFHRINLGELSLQPYEQHALARQPYNNNRNATKSSKEMPIFDWFRKAL